ncbi:MAG: sulfite exporter TauE/SafE family protein [Dehalococcoidia bacterium]
MSRRALYLVSGGAGGLFSGLVGGGGGAIMVPIMTGPLRMEQHLAHGTSLAIIILTALAAALTYSSHGHFDAQLAASMMVAATIAAFCGARVARRIPALRLRQLFAVFLIAVALRLLVMPSIDPVFGHADATTWTVGPAIGFAGGFLSGALGVGGGAVFVPALVLVLGLEQHDAQGISLWVVVAATIAGALTHHRQGTVDLRAVAWMTPLSIPAGVAGAYIADALGARTLQVVVSGILVAVGIQMFTTAARRLRQQRQATMLRAGSAAP